MRLVLATEEEAMVCRSWGFSFSRLKGLGGLDFLGDLEDLVKGWPEEVRDGPPLEEGSGAKVRVVGVVEEEEDGVRRLCMGPPPPETETLWPKGSSFSPGSDSLSTREDSWRVVFLRWGSCLWRAAVRSMPGVLE